MSECGLSSIGRSSLARALVGPRSRLVPLLPTKAQEIGRGHVILIYRRNEMCHILHWMSICCMLGCHGREERKFGEVVQAVDREFDAEGAQSAFEDELAFFHPTETSGPKGSGCDLTNQKDRKSVV